MTHFKPYKQKSNTKKSPPWQKTHNWFRLPKSPQTPQETYRNGFVKGENKETGDLRH